MSDDMSLHFGLGHCEKTGTELQITPDHIAFSRLPPCWTCDAITKQTDPDSIERRHRVKEVFYNAYAAGHVSSACRNAIEKRRQETDLIRMRTATNIILFVLQE